jgi:hypothetical protein
MLKLVGATGMSADDLVAPKERDSKAEAAAELVRHALANGPVPSSELQELAREHGISDGTLAEARRREGAVSRRQGKAWVTGYPHQFSGPAAAPTQPDRKESPTVDRSDRPDSGHDTNADADRPEETATASDSPAVQR